MGGRSWLGHSLLVADWFQARVSQLLYPTPLISSRRTERFMHCGPAGRERGGAGEAVRKMSRCGGWDATLLGGSVIHFCPTESGNVVTGWGRVGLGHGHRLAACFSSSGMQEAQVGASPMWKDILLTLSSNALQHSMGLPAASLGQPLYCGLMQYFSSPPGICTANWAGRGQGRLGVRPEGSACDAARYRGCIDQNVRVRLHFDTA